MTRLVRELGVALDLRSVLTSLDDCAHVVLTENSAQPAARSRWAFLATDPVYVFHSVRGKCWGGPPGREQRLDDAPLEALAGLLSRRRTSRGADEPPWCSGAGGYLGYELLHEIEDVPDAKRGVSGPADCRLAFFDAVAATDLVAGRTWIAGRDGAATEQLTARLEAARPLSRAGDAPAPRPARVGVTDLARAEADPVVSREDYLSAIAAVDAHLLAGDCYEVCLTQRFDTHFAGSGTALYAALCRTSPAPHAAYVRTGDVEIACASPELFLRAGTGGAVQTRPIKGTRPRGLTPGEDARLAAELAAAEKDAAENLMIVDLSRNDLGRVCEFGSIRVPEMRVVETHAHTHQLVSTITGRLRPGVGTVELLRATFPGGSMTGAPKVAAMSIIDRLEPVPRGPYAGSIGWIDDSGALDLNIVIRSLVKTGDVVTFHTGGAIVADSDPESEYQETLDKAAGMLAALRSVRR
ncbi:MAG: aminodeoxychorismate synthase component I [Acidimicrobiia bacterium]|nr:aminodeoxychorismate synthase component I [Acidimicrobiia bacterium]